MIKFTFKITHPGRIPWATCLWRLSTAFAHSIGSFSAFFKNCSNEYSIRSRHSCNKNGFTNVIICNQITKVQLDFPKVDCNRMNVMKQIWVDINDNCNPNRFLKNENNIFRIWNHVYENGKRERKVRDWEGGRET